jgi:hypothetical protein
MNENMFEYEKEILSPGVVLYKNIFDPAGIIEEIEKESAQDWPYLMWEVSPTGYGTVSDYRQSSQMELSPIMLESVQDSHRLFDLHKQWLGSFRKINACVHAYRADFDLELREDEGYRILKYPSGAEYRPHIDFHYENERQLSLVGWLNDDFEGGELHFTHLDLTIPCQAGSFVLFPSGYLHKHAALSVKENSNNIKYSFVTWFK